MNNIFFEKKKKFILLKEIFNICKQNYSENHNKKIFGVNNLIDANNREISFLNKAKYINDAKYSKALVCIVSEKFKKYLSDKTIPVISKHPDIDFFKVVNLFYTNAHVDREVFSYVKIINKLKKKISIGKNTLISKTAEIGNNVSIGNNVIIYPYVKIGNGSIIGSNVIISNAFIGDNVVIKSGTIIGQIGFGFKYFDKKRFSFPHIGKVVIENNCQIGSLCTIDRGTLSDTIVGEFTTIDNQVQIAHNVKIGNYCIIASQVGIAGSTVIGNNVMIGGQVGISDNLKIGNNVKIGGKSGVVSDIEDFKIVMGYPAKNFREFVRQSKK